MNAMMVKIAAGKFTATSILCAILIRTNSGADAVGIGRPVPTCVGVIALTRRPVCEDEKADERSVTTNETMKTYTL